MVIHTHNVQNYSSVMLQMIQHKIFLDEVEKIIGSDIVLHHTKLFEKSPKKGAAFPLHQDWSYFPTKYNTMIAAVIHLSNSTEEMGCFRIITGSHKHGPLDNSDGHKHNPEIHSKYNLDEAYKMWERMDKLNSGNRTPEFLSTHPSSKTRIENIKKWIPLVKENY